MTLVGHPAAGPGIRQEVDPCPQDQQHIPAPHPDRTGWRPSSSMFRRGSPVSSSPRPRSATSAARGLLPLPPVLGRRPRPQPHASRTSGTCCSTASCPTPTEPGRLRRGGRAPLRRLPAEVLEALPAIAAAVGAGPLAGLRTALSLLRRRRAARRSTTADARRPAADAARGSARSMPTLLDRPAPARPRTGPDRAPRRPRPRGQLPVHAHRRGSRRPPAARAVEQYLISTVDHGFNASTFTARVIASTGADVGACRRGRARRALRAAARRRAQPGPGHPRRDRHPGPDRRLGPRARSAAGERIMGFGHAVYRTEDPRSVLLREIAQRLGGPLVDFAVAGRGRRSRRAGRAQARPRAAHQRRVLRRRGDGACGLPAEMFTPDLRGRAGSSAGARTSWSRRPTPRSSARAPGTSARPRRSPSPTPAAGRPGGRLPDWLAWRLIMDDPSSDTPGTGQHRPDAAMTAEWIMVGVGMLLTLGTGVFVAAEFTLVNLDRAELEARRDRGERGLTRPSRRCGSPPPISPGPSSASPSPRC